MNARRHGRRRAELVVQRCSHSPTYPTRSPTSRTMATTTILPMWRSPTEASATYQKLGEDRWEDDDMDYSTCSATTLSPSRAVQCQNFMAQVDRVVITSSHRTFHDTEITIDVYLTELDGTSPSTPTYQITRTLSEFEELRNEITLTTSNVCKPITSPVKSASARCTLCASYQLRCAAWEHHWPRNMFSRLFQRKAKYEAFLQQMLTELVTLGHSETRLGENHGSCASHSDVPAALTSFLVRHELSIDE